MAHYANRGRAPRCPTEAEVLELLRVSGEHRGGLRDHVILGLAVGAGLRELEIAGLDVTDVVTPERNVRQRLRLRIFKGWRRAPPGTVQEVRIGEQLRYKLGLYFELLGPVPLERPLFVSQKGGRISTRRLREIGEKWQRRARWERLCNFHGLRHWYCTQVYRESGRDIVQVQRLARHARIETSLRYMHPSEDELGRTADKLPG